MTSETKHTPGPWRRVNWHVHAGCPVIGRTEGELGCDAVAYVVGGSGEMAREEFQANLSLIAAAPDLLAACEMALHLHNEAFRGYADHTDYGRALRAAIAKAKGEAP